MKYIRNNCCQNCRQNYNKNSAIYTCEVWSRLNQIERESKDYPDDELDYYGHKRPSRRSGNNDNWHC